MPDPWADPAEAPVLVFGSGQRSGSTLIQRLLTSHPGVLVVEQRDLLRNRETVLGRVFEFLEVDPDFVSPSWDEQHNRATDHRVPTDLALRLGPRAERFEDRRFARPLLSKPVPKPRLTRQQRRRVVALLKPEAERLREMTGVSIAHWRF